MAKVKVRIAVAVDDSGDWMAAGADVWDDEEAEREADLCPGDTLYWLETELDIPEPKVIEPTVTRAE